MMINAILESRGNAMRKKQYNYIDDRAVSPWEVML